VRGDMGEDGERRTGRAQRRVDHHVDVHGAGERSADATADGGAQRDPEPFP